MKELSKLMNYRSDVRVVDATLRDGGLVNDFRFSDEFVRDLYLANIKAGVDYMEFGYRADKEMFKVDDFGPCKFCDDEYLRSIVGENHTDLKIAIMADVGRCNYKQDIVERENSPVDLIRVATYIHQIPTAVDMIEDAKKKGYEVSCNIMAISNAQEADVKVALDILGQSPVDVFYIVDSFGSIYPEQMARIANIYLEYAEKYGKKVGVHAHNNQQLAFANTIEAVGDGVDWLDATYSAMGRGAGNCAMELLLGFLKNPKYDLRPVLDAIQELFLPLKEKYEWGYIIPQMITGMLNRHPQDAIAVRKTEDKDKYRKFYERMIND